MKTILSILSTLATICYGAAIPQSLVDPGTADQTYTFVIPCNVPGCSPRTVTLYGRDEPTPILGEPSRTVDWDSGVTQTGVILPRGPEPQVIGTPTRSIIISPSNPWPTSASEATVTVTITKSLPPTLSPCSPTEISSSASGPPTSTAVWPRQGLGEPTRSIFWWPPGRQDAGTTSTNYGTASSPTSKIISSSTLKVSSADSCPTSSAILSKTTSSSEASSHVATSSKSSSPHGVIPPPPPTNTETIITISRSVTTYVEPEEPATLVARQSLLTPSRSVIIWPWGPIPTRPTVTVTETMTVTPPHITHSHSATTTPIIFRSTSIYARNADPEAQGLGDPTWSITFWEPTGTPTSVLSVPLNTPTDIIITPTLSMRQELETPTRVVGSYPGEAKEREMEQGEKRQELGKPTRSLIAEPSTLVAKTRSVGWGG
ncbi:hypothetical protein B7494_g4863 [Chlorociboria aeruginascens]|nr:hypothetical protein B7494_g4863 [Chlorociboria aeruginascens]